MHDGRVVNIKSGEPYDVYIGWESPRYRQTLRLRR
jgi:hypothetical protein